MNDQYVRNVIEAALLAAGRPLAADELAGLFDERDGSNAGEVQARSRRCAATMQVAASSSWKSRAAIGSRSADLWCSRFATVAGAAGKVLPRVARDSGARSLSPADHPRRDRADSRRCVNPTSLRRCSSAAGFAWSGIATYREGRSCSAPLESSWIISICRSSTICRRWTQLKELEDLRLQLTLPGEAAATAEATPRRRSMRRVRSAGGRGGRRSGGAQGRTSAADEDELEADETQPRAQGLVARGAADDAD